jgi:nucleotide-binding universal stress UspA family protein
MGRTAAAAAPRMVVGVTGSAASVAAVTWAVREAELRGAVLHAVHAWESAARGRASYVPGLREQRDDERNAATALLHSVVQRGMGADQPRLDGAGPLIEVAEGLPVQVLLHCAAGADLLVLGGSQAAEEGSGRPAADLGPVARACLRAAPCPVVAVSPEHVRGLVPGRSRRLVGALS